MSTANSWLARKKRLGVILNTAPSGGETEEGLALDRLLHGQAVIGKTGAPAGYFCLAFTE